MNTCAWCDTPTTTDGLCNHCQTTPWPAGARYTLTRLWLHDGRTSNKGQPMGGYVYTIVDRAHSHHIAVRSHNGYGRVRMLERLRALNRDNRP